MNFYILLMIGVYVLLFVSFLILFFLIKKHLIKVLKDFEDVLDEVFYEVSIKLVKYSGKIAKLDEFLDLFQINKKEFFKKENKQIDDFIKFWNDYKSDIKYFGELVENSIISDNLISKLDNLSEGLLIINRYYKFVKKVLCFMSFGLFCIFFK